jgi:transposase
VKIARDEWIAEQSTFDINRLVFIDEAGAKTNMTRLYGRSVKGVRAYDHAPHGHWCTTTMISSIRLNGETACMTVNAATSGDVFRVYVERVLVPSLREGDLVILDNLSAHKDKVALERIKEVGAQVRFLPPYSPDFNPIEKMWSKVKQLLRGMKARTEETLLLAIGTALSCVTEADARGWFISCGYSLN